MFSGHVSERGCGGIGPGQEFVEAALRMAVDDAGDDVGEVGVRIDADKLAGFDQRSDHGPVLGTAVGTGEESVLAIRYALSRWDGLCLFLASASLVFWL